MAKSNMDVLPLFKTIDGEIMTPEKKAAELVKFLTKEDGRPKAEVKVFVDINQTTTVWLLGSKISGHLGNELLFYDDYDRKEHSREDLYNFLVKCISVTGQTDFVVTKILADGDRSRVITVYSDEIDWIETVNMLVRDNADIKFNQIEDKSRTDYREIVSIEGKPYKVPVFSLGCHFNWTSCVECEQHLMRLWRNMLSKKNGQLQQQ